ETRHFAEVLAASQAPGGAPFPTSQILLTRRGPGAREQTAGFAQVALLPCLVSEIDVGRVKISPCAISFHFRITPRTRGGLSRLPLGFQRNLLGPFRPPRPNRLRGAHTHANQQSKRNSRRGR